MFSRAEAPRRRLLKTLFERGARPLVRAAHGLAARFELLSDFRNSQPDDIAHQQHRSLTWRQVLQSRDKGELGRLTLVVQGLWARRSVRENVEQTIRIRFEPGHLTSRHAEVL